MKILYKYCLIIASVLFLFSCKKETEGLSRITDYVEFVINGDNPAVVQVGDPYVDAGVVATLDGQDVTSKVTVANNVDYETMGMYTVEYTSPVNADGLKSRAVRNVIVCNPGVTADISGTWDVVADESYRSPATYYGGKGFTVKMNKLAPGFFTVSDFLAGWYEVRAGYGSAYAISGYIALNEDNTISLISSNLSPWGIPIDYLNGGFYDPDTKPDVECIKWVAGFGAPLGSPMQFNVSLTKNK